MGEISLTPWRRYGHDRVYISAGDRKVGYLNRANAELVLDDASLREEVTAALVAAAYLEAPADRPMTERSRRRQQARRDSFARRSWQAPTLSEKALADELLRSSPFVWAREVPWEQYRLDFYCEAARVAVEVDGSSHRRKEAADAERDAYFRGLGVETVRVSAEDVERDCAAVVAALNRTCIGRTGTVPATEVPAPGLIARLLGRTERVERPALAPEEYRGRRRGGQFVCARCRGVRSAAERSSRAANCCTRCTG